MRPRVFPAEDGGGNDLQYRAFRASMRPRVFPAEDSPPSWGCESREPCFNEAAGIPRGRLAVILAFRGK